MRRETVREGFRALNRELQGEIQGDRLARLLYAQDASVYEKEPLGVVYPKNREDVQRVVKIASLHEIPLIPRGGGTSLAGQCVGRGLVLDFTRHMNQILEVYPDEKKAVVQPGITLGDLNRALEDSGLMFGPDTSTADQCTIGGMIGNNSAGSHSIFYGTTRDNVSSFGTVFADGTYEEIGRWTPETFQQNTNRADRLGEGLEALRNAVEQHSGLIREKYPSPDVIRRNTGYPLDAVLRMEPFESETEGFHLPSFLTGTEGTLGIVTHAELELVDRPSSKQVVAPHFESIRGALKATVDAVQTEPAAVELIDKRVLDQTVSHPEHQTNRFFLEGDPAAILIVEYYGDSRDNVEEKAEKLRDTLADENYGYAYPEITPPQDKQVWALRKAGLGLLMGMFGDTKPVTVVEDTAVSVRTLPEYIDDFNQIMEKYDTQCVYYGHASVGELHLRPELNLKKRSDVERFKKIAGDVASLVQEHDGALSGEHGDGRLRAPMLEDYFGTELLEAHQGVKQAFDPKGILNPGKILEPPSLDSDLRTRPGTETPEYETYFDWSDDGGLIQAIEKCNGAGVCRKRAEAGGTMCPSYMATEREKDTTRGRANVFRQVFLNQSRPDSFSSEELREALDLCLSCKACQSECPANVDMAKLKAEFFQHYYEENSAPLSAMLFGYYGKISRLASWMPRITNFILSMWIVRWFLDTFVGISRQRQLPSYASQTFSEWFRGRQEVESEDKAPAVWLYVDPFTEYTEPEIAKAAVDVLETAGNRVEILPIADDGRTLLSKGFVADARELWAENAKKLREAFRQYPDRPVVGLEPSAVLTFVDEAPDLVTTEDAEVVEKLADRTYLFEEFLAEQIEADADCLPANAVDDEPRVVLHRHCHEEAIRGTKTSAHILEHVGYDVQQLDTGCCGMAGSFGYEKEHFETSMEIGELTLFPALRDESDDTRIAAPGTSCREQIRDGVGRNASHPAVLLREAL